MGNPVIADSILAMIIIALVGLGGLCLYFEGD